jgi:hypothetical protein
MRSTLATLKRVRDIHKKVSRQAFVTAERNRIEQEGVVVRVEERIRATYEVDAGITAGSMMQVHDWRTKLSSDLVREEDLLRSRVESANRRRDDLRELTRDARVVELALERYDEEAPPGWQAHRRHGHRPLVESEVLNGAVDAMVAGCLVDGRDGGPRPVCARRHGSRRSRGQDRTHP